MTGPRGRILARRNAAGAVAQNYTFNSYGKVVNTSQPKVQNSAVISITRGGTSFKYDPFGRRIQKSSTSTTTNYLYDGSNLLEEVDQSGNVPARYTQSGLIDEALSALRSGATSYFEEDGLSSISSLSNSAGGLANTYSYDSYGKLTASTGTVTNSLRYTGREFDSETGLYYYRARYNDPTLARFLNEDPIGFESGDNDFYRYVRDNPVNLGDPFGLQGGAGTAPAPSPITPPPDPIVTAPVPSPCVVCIPIMILLNPTELNGGEQDWIERRRQRENRCEKKKKRNRNDCMKRYLEEREFCSRYFGTVLYGMCRDRAFWRFSNCQKGLDDPGPLDPLDPDWSID